MMMGTQDKGDTESPPTLTAQQSSYLLSNLKTWSLFNGLTVSPSPKYIPEFLTIAKVLAIPAPVTLYPSPFPRKCFDEARAIQCAYNFLYAAIAQDEEWLGKIVEELTDVDDFISKLWNVHKQAQSYGYHQSHTLGIFRSDYMIHQTPDDAGVLGDSLKQVEFNTIASSFGGLSSKVSELHSHLLSIGAYPGSIRHLINESSLPPNPSIAAIAEGLVVADRIYGGSKVEANLPKCVLFVVQHPENNIFDQYAISSFLESQDRVQPIITFRLEFSSVLQYTTLSNDGSPKGGIKHGPALLYHPPHAPDLVYEVSVIYYRAGYSPDEYPTSEQWEARLHLERSAAIKCPSVLTHLAGSKKIQQILASPSSKYLEHFLAGTEYEDFIDRIRATFTTIYPLDQSDLGQQAITIAQDSRQSQNYVLKPQREGGGNNIYGEKIPHFLASLGKETDRYKGHILMEMIRPPSLKNSIFREGQVQTGQVIGELGIYGVCVWKTGSKSASRLDVIANHEAGFLLRTKGRDSEEGGVAAGFGCVDSPCLV